MSQRISLPKNSSQNLTTKILKGILKTEDMILTTKKNAMQKGSKSVWLSLRPLHSARYTAAEPGGQGATEITNTDMCKWQEYVESEWDTVDGRNPAPVDR